MERKCEENIETKRKKEKMEEVIRNEEKWKLAVARGRSHLPPLQAR